MSHFKLASEAEIYASDLKFRLCFMANEDKNNFIGDPGCKQEDAIQNLNNIKRLYTEPFK